MGPRQNEKADRAPTVAVAGANVDGDLSINVQNVQNIRGSSPWVHAIWAVALFICVALVCVTLVVLKVIDARTALLVGAGAIGSSGLSAHLTARFGGPVKLATVLGTVFVVGVPLVWLLIVLYQPFTQLDPGPESELSANLDYLAHLQHGLAFSERWHPPVNRRIARVSSHPDDDSESEADDSTEPLGLGPISYLARREGRATKHSGDREGTIPAATIQRIVRANAPAVRGCLPNQITEVDVLFAFVIEHTGMVASSRVTASNYWPAYKVSGLSHEGVKRVRAMATRFAECLAKRYLEVGFPRVAGSYVTVTYPMHFGSQ